MEKEKEPEGAPSDDTKPTPIDEHSIPATATSAAPPAPVKPHVPDSDDEDDDELDDLLDEFSPLNVADKEAPSSSGPGRPTAGADDALALAPAPTETEDEFAAKLQEGMGELLKELDNDPELARQMEALVKGLQAQEAVGVPGSSTAVEEEVMRLPAGGAGEETFQDTIRKTMERMQNSGDSVTAATAGGADDDILAQLLKEMEGGGGGGGGGEGDEDLTKMFLNMMEQLTNKEMLYEPMKELNGKFPDWIKENKGKVEEEKMKSYEEQASIVKEIVAKFEQPGYTDEKPEDRAYIWERMQKMQAAGSPPEDLVANPLGGEGMPTIPQLGEDGVPGCPAQ